MADWRRSEVRLNAERKSETQGAGSLKVWADVFPKPSMVLFRSNSTVGKDPRIDSDTVGRGMGGDSWMDDQGFSKR